MSLKIIKTGIMDTIQDLGRYGYQHLGINPGGAMDAFSMEMVNLLVGNKNNEAVIEMHFPAATFLFEQDCIIAIGGADFLPTINGDPIPLYHPVCIEKNSVLQFRELKNGTRCYLAIKDGLQTAPWLNSSSANLKIKTNDLYGRALQKDDVICFKKQNNYSALPQNNGMLLMPWKADINWHIFNDDSIYILPGSEWDWLNDDSKKIVLNDSFTITTASDRMGYKTKGPKLSKIYNVELVSSPVTYGTIQLLPDGQLIILMADHQTTGGYPRIANVITAHHSKLSQMRPGEKIRFSITDIITAERLQLKQQQHLRQLQNACKFRLEDFLNKGKTI